MATYSTVKYSTKSSRVSDFCVLLLIILFCYAATSKLISLELFRQQLLNQTIPAEVSRVLVYLLPGIELLAVGFLIYKPTRRLGLIAASLLMLAFTGYIALVLLGFWDRIPCSCGGILNSMSWTAHLVFNLFFLAIALFALIKTTTGQAENLRKE